MGDMGDHSSSSSSSSSFFSSSSPSSSFFFVFNHYSFLFPFFFFLFPFFSPFFVGNLQSDAIYSATPRGFTRPPGLPCRTPLPIGRALLATVHNYAFITCFFTNYIISYQKENTCPMNLRADAWTHRRIGA